MNHGGMIITTIVIMMTATVVTVTRIGKTVGTTNDMRPDTLTSRPFFYDSTQAPSRLRDMGALPNRVTTINANTLTSHFNIGHTNA